MRVAYTVSQIRMSVLKVTHEVLEKLEISPYPVIITNNPLKSQRRVSMHSTTRAYADIVFNQNYTVNSSILRDATIMNKLSSVLILYNFITVQSKKVCASYSPLNVVISWQTILDIRTQFLLPNYGFF